VLSEDRDATRPFLMVDESALTDVRHGPHLGGSFEERLDSLKVDRDGVEPMPASTWNIEEGAGIAGAETRPWFSR